MKGESKITLNHDTVLEAIQLWLEANFKHPAPVATNVCTKTDNYSTDFVVTMKPAPEPVPGFISAIFEAPEKK